MTQSSLIILQSGGPTAVLNASLAGAIRAARQAGFQRVLGAKRAVEGLLTGDFIDLGELDDQQLQRLKHTPSAALVSSRRRPDDDECRQILERCRTEQVAGVVAIGGNDTAETVRRLAEMALDAGLSTSFVSVPKTIDNDLMGTDHSLGYPSAARFMALAARDSAMDTLGTGDRAPVKIIESMGRNAGWLPAAASLAFDAALPSPLICLPERPVAGFEALAAEVERRLQADGMAMLIVPETMRWAGGEHVAGTEPDWVDPFGHPYFPSAGDALSRRLTTALGVASRCDRPGTIARMAMHAASQLDIKEAEQCGAEAVKKIAAGETGLTIAISRVSEDPYRVEYQAIPVQIVAGIERQIPDEMIAPDGHSLTNDFRRYAAPLVGEFERYEVLVGSGSGNR